jgi:glutaminyl-peptide cyclotransferase
LSSKGVSPLEAARGATPRDGEGSPARRLGWILLLGLLLCTASLPGRSPAAGESDPVTPVFSGERAMALLRYQCELGPRVPGSEGHRALQEAIVAHADSLGLSLRRHCFQAEVPLGVGSQELCNLVISAGPAGGQRLWLGAHYDTRPVCDRDPDPARRDEPLPGANDGASGVAVLLHLAELLAQRPPPRGVDLIFLDGEDGGRASQPAEFCLGSARLAGEWESFASPLAGGEPEGLVLLDMVGERGLDIPQESYSLYYAADWTAWVFSRAASLGLQAFRADPGPAVYDDHVPFLREGIPAVDLIDFDYPQWHTSGDVPATCAAASLEQVGRLVADLAYNPR